MQRQLRDVLLAYGKWIESFVEAGWQPHHVVFMFNPLSGSNAARWAQMSRGIEEVYGKILTRTHRVPNAARNRDRLPVLIAVPDFPVYKRDRDKLTDIKLNDGHHAHAIWVMPPVSRMQARGEDLSGHFLNYGNRYTGKGRALQRIRSERIYTRPAYVTDYAFKAIKTDRAADSDIIVLPRTRSEVH